MKKFFCKTIIVFLLFMTISPQVLARGNYSFTQVNEEIYNASSPVGYFASYPHGATNFTASQFGGYMPYPATNSYVSSCSMPATVQYIQTPQSYNRKVVSSRTYRDEREGIDKAIDRTGKIIGIVGIGALLGTGVAAIINAI